MPPDETPTYGKLMQQLKYLRMREGLDIKELGKRTGIGRASLQAVEQSRFDMGGDKLKMLADYYGLTTYVLLQNDFMAAFKTFITLAVPTHRLTAEYEAINKNSGHSGMLGEDWVFKKEMKKLGYNYQECRQPQLCR